MIILRNLQHSDLNYFLKWWRDKELIAVTSGVFEELSDEEVKKDFLGMLQDPHRIDRMIEINGIVIGHISLVEQPGRWWELQTVIGEKAFLGRGLGTEAITKLISELDRDIVGQIFLEVRPDNERAIRAYEKCGFVKKHLIDHRNNPNLPRTLRMEYADKV